MSLKKIQVIWQPYVHPGCGDAPAPFAERETQNFGHFGVVTRNAKTRVCVYSIGQIKGTKVRKRQGQEIKLLLCDGAKNKKLYISSV